MAEYQLDLPHVFEGHEAEMLPWTVATHSHYSIGFRRCGFVGQALVIMGCQSGQL